MSAKSTATISQYCCITESTSSFSLHSEPRPVPGAISASFALRWPSALLCSDPTSAHHADTREAWEKEEREVCKWNWGCFSALPTRAHLSLRILSFSWLRNLPD